MRQTACSRDVAAATSDAKRIIRSMRLLYDGVMKPFQKTVEIRVTLRVHNVVIKLQIKSDTA